jgi:hypothetical protein
MLQVNVCFNALYPQDKQCDQQITHIAVVYTALNHLPILILLTKLTHNKIINKIKFCIVLLSHKRQSSTRSDILFIR